MAAKKTSSRSTKSTASKKKTAAKKAPSRKKTAAKTVARKKPVAKKSAAKKPAAKASATKKSTARKTGAPVKQPATGKKAAAKSKSASAGVPKTQSETGKSSNGKKPVAAGSQGPAVIEANRTTAAPSGRQNKHLTAKELRDFRQRLLNLRDQVVDEISFLAGDNLSAKQIERTGEEGTDNFNREFALKLVSSEQDIIYEIDEALRRIKTGTYGICEFSGEAIEKERLKVVPHARHSVKVQSELEKGRARYRPFGPSLARP